VAVVAFIAYQLIAVLMTWPLIAGVAGDVPGDLGDSLLNMWILAWGAEQVPRLLTGQISLEQYWNANIFHPEPLALAFSEHLFGQALQVLPVYHLTQNIILSYNLIFLTTFALSGLGMFLLVRDLFPGDPKSGVWALAPAIIAGLIYAFLPYRVAQIAHIQSLSSQWMPLALYGLRRFVVTGRTRPLVGGAAALLMQNWSCGYYLLYFAPFVPLFVIHQMWTSGRLREWRAWMSLAAAALAVTIGTWPFLALYLEAARVHGFERPLAEITRFSADVYGYFSASAALRVWGPIMQAFPKPEGELFLGLVPMVLATFGLIALLPGLKSSPSSQEPPYRVGPAFSRGLSVFLLLLVAVQVAAFIAIVLTGGFVTSLIGIPVRATNGTRVLAGAAAAAGLLLAVSADARRRANAFLRSPIAIAAALALLAVWLSLGPSPQSRGESLQIPALYGLLYEYVAGFDGLRVPARYVMIAGLFLTIMAGGGAAAALFRSGRQGWAGAALAGVFLIEAAFAPMPINLSWGGRGVEPPDRVEPAYRAPAVYRHLATMPDATAIAEFPFGDPAWELRYVYYSTVHWKPIVNGYSGGFPQGYQARVAMFERIGERPEEAWAALKETGATHAIVHDTAFAPGEADVVKRWLDDHFAVEIARFDGDLLYDLRGAWGNTKDTKDTKEHKH
jgi:hypothetical protein